MKEATQSYRYYRNFEERVPTQTGETALDLRFLGSIVFYFVWLSLRNCRVVGEARFFPKLGFQKVCSVRRSKITATFLHFQILHVSTSEI